MLLCARSVTIATMLMHVCNFQSDHGRTGAWRFMTQVDHDIIQAYLETDYQVCGDCPFTLNISRHVLSYLLCIKPIIPVATLYYSRESLQSPA